MTTATKGEEVTCENGHVVGSFKEDVADGAAIDGGNFGVDLNLAKIVGTAGSGSYVCKCGGHIARQGPNGYSVHTARGWISQQQC